MLSSFQSIHQITCAHAISFRSCPFPTLCHSLPQKPSCTHVQHVLVLLSPVKCVCRQADLSKLPDKTGHPISHPSVLTHVDFTESSGPKVLERYFGAEAAAQIKQKPWAIIQVCTYRTKCWGLVSGFRRLHLADV